MSSKKTEDATEGLEVTPDETGTPLDDVFDPIEIDDMEEEYERIRIKPLPKGSYKVRLTGEYVMSKSGPDSKKPGTPMVQFNAEVVDDSDPANIGRKVRTQRFMLSGGGFIFFLNFAKAVRPSRMLKKHTILFNSDGKSQYFASFRDCVVGMEVAIQKDRDTGKLTDFNEVTGIFEV